MKMREPHIVPLPRQAVKLLRELQTITGIREHLFPNLRNPKRPMTNTTTNRALEYMGYAGLVSSHGFRGTASTVLNEMGYHSDVIERQLAHKPRNAIRAAYNHAELLPERRQMLQDWADMIDAWQQGAKVIPGKFGQSADEPKGDEAWTIYRARRAGTVAQVIDINPLERNKS
jgi:integrase